MAELDSYLRLSAAEGFLRCTQFQRVYRPCLRGLGVRSTTQGSGVGERGRGQGGGCPESFVFMLHLTLHSTFHLKVSIVSQSRLDPGLLASERPLCPILHSENKVSPFVHLLSWKGCWDLVSCVCERVLVCIWVCVSKTPVHTNVKQWIVAPPQTPLLIKVLKKR